MQAAVRRQIMASVAVAAAVGVIVVSGVALAPMVRHAFDAIGTGVAVISSTVTGSGADEVRKDLERMVAHREDQLHTLERRLREIELDVASLVAAERARAEAAKRKPRPKPAPAQNQEPAQPQKKN